MVPIQVTRAVIRPIIFASHIYFGLLMLLLVLLPTSAAASDFAALHRMNAKELRQALHNDPASVETRLALIRKLGQVKQAEAIAMLPGVDRSKLSKPQKLYYNALACAIILRSGDIEKAEPYCEQTRATLEAGSGDPISDAMGRNALGGLLLRQGKPRLALDELEQGLSLTSGGRDDVLHVAILHNHGVALTLYGLTDLAIESFEAADQAKGLLPPDDPLPTILAYNLGYLQAQRGEHEAALKSYAIAAAWLTESRQDARAHIAASEIAMSLSALGRYSQALATIEPWINRKDVKITPDSQAQSYLALGTAYLGLGRNNIARETLLKGISIAREADNPTRLRELSLAYARMLIDEQRYTSAIDYLEELIGILKANEITDGLGRAHELLANAYAQVSDYQSAWANSLMAAEMQSIAQSEAFDRRLASLRISNELDVKDQQLALARERESAAITSQKLAELIQIATVTGVLIALIVTYLLFSRRQKQREAEIQRNVADHLEREVEERTHETELELEKRLAAETARADLEFRLLKDDKLRAIGQLTGGVAHDFNNLMTVVLLSAEMLEPHLEAEQKKLITDIIKATQSGRAITRGLLAYARQQTLKPTAIELNSYLDTNLSLFRQSLDERIELITSVSQEKSPHIITADPGQLTTCLLNLVLNAREAISDTGKITLSVGRAADKVAITVTDTGCGMSEAEVATATEPFYTTKSASQGAGLGLSMVYGFVIQSGGEMKIQSQPGQGTQITLLFSEASEIEQSQPVTTTELTQGQGLSILIVEDEPGIREVAKAALSGDGYHVTVAQNGDAALSQLEQFGDLDLLISDLVMPGETSGEDLVRTARARFPQLPVILMSGYANDIPSGFRFLPKPFSLHDLKEAVQQEIAATT